MPAISTEPRSQAGSWIGCWPVPKSIGGGRGGDEDQADGEEHLVELAGAVEPAEERALEDDADQRRREEGDRQRGEEGQAELAHGE